MFGHGCMQKAWQRYLKYSVSIEDRQDWTGLPNYHWRKQKMQENYQFGKPKGQLLERKWQAFGLVSYVGVINLYW